jgi:predicted PurR-regulated permease PerM
MTVSQRWFFLTVFVLISVFVYLLQPILMPFLLGALIAYVGDPVVDRFEEIGWPRALGVTLVFALLTIVGVISLLLVIPSLLEQLNVLRASIPQAVVWIEQTVIPWLAVNFGVDFESFSSEGLRQAVQERLSGHGSLLAAVAKKVTVSSISMLVWAANLLLVPVVSFYLMRDWDLIVAKIHALLPRNVEQTVVQLAQESNEVLGSFFKGQLLVMLSLGIIYSLGLWIVGVDLALLIGMVAGLSSIVPYLGFIVGIGFALIASAFQFQEWLPLVYVCVVFGVGQILESVLLTPILVGDKIGLHPVAVIFAIMAGGQLFGFTGVLLALPVAAVAMVILRYAYTGYKESHIYHAGHDKPDE